MDILAEDAMRARLSMLFNAGLLLFMAKDNAPDEQIKCLYFR